MPLSMRVESPGKRKRTYVGVFHKRKDSFKDASLVFAYVDNKGTFGRQWRRWFTIGQFNLLTDEQRQRWIDVQRRFSHAYEDGRVDVDDWMQASANVCDELLEEGLPQ